MLELFAELGNRIVTGGFKTHLAVYIISSVIGILMLQLVFSKLLKIVARKTNISYPLLQQTFRGIPAFLGILIQKDAFFCACKYENIVKNKCIYVKKARLFLMPCGFRHI